MWGLLPLSSELPTPESQYDCDDGYDDDDDDDGYDDYCAYDDD